MSCCVDYDGPVFETEKWVKARKNHRCCECRAEINPGEEYQYISGMYEGMFYVNKSCEKCADLRESLQQVWCTYLENLRDDYKEYCNETGKFKWSDDGEEIIYPDNHMNLNDKPLHNSRGEK